ncbi:MAG: hypothetical protein JRI56_08965 [Deltaproteobacteria bacterium]|nr:hypothetical protein [Deltaproteobacteria bacterium]
MASSYLAIRSLFSSSLYRSASLFVTRQLGALGVTTIASAQMDQAIPLLLSGLVFLRVMYNYALGRPGNIVSIFEMNLALFTPEALSFSRINWFNLIGQPQLLQPSRGFTEVLMTGIFIMAGYITLLFTSRYRETTGELRRRGAEPGEVDEALAHQTLYSAALSLAAASIIAATAFSIRGVGPDHRGLPGLLPQGEVGFLGQGEGDPLYGRGESTICVVIRNAGKQQRTCKVSPRIEDWQAAKNTTSTIFKAPTTGYPLEGRRLAICILESR